MFVVLLTPRSIVRPWVWYESGVAWLSGRRTLPVVAGGLANPHARTIAIVGFVWMVFAVGTAVTRSVATVGLRLTTDGRSGRGRLHGGEPHPASSP